MKDILLLIIIWLFPYQLAGEETGTYFLLATLAIYLFVKKEGRLAGNRGFMFLLLGLCAISLISAFFSATPIRSLYGAGLSGTALLSYLAVQNLKEERFIKWSLYGISIGAFISLVGQGVLRGMRVYGNYGYANTFALVLFIGIAFSEVIKDKKWDFYLKLVLMTALFFTGDRTMIICLIAWALFRGIRNSELHLLLTVMFSAVFYILCDQLGFISLLLAPILVFVFNSLYHGLLKRNRMFVVVTVLGILAGTMIFSANTVNRLKNISLKNGSLIERLISFEDVLREVPGHLLGRGANSYEYSQYALQSAFYESKYVHNSLLQYLFDFGLPGVLLFAGISGYGFYLISASSHSQKGKFQVIYAAIFLHSLLNFDFAYPTIWIVLAAMVAFCSGKSEFTMAPGKYRWLFCLLGAGCMVFFLHEGTIKVAQWGVTKGRPDLSERALMIQAKLNIPDDRVTYVKAGAEQLRYEQSHHLADLNAAKQYLSKAQSLNQVDPRIKWNYAFVLAESKSYNAAEKVWKQVLVEERFNPLVYQMYEQFLQKKYNGKANIPESKLHEWKQIMNKSKKELNPKAHLLPNQL